ncbi:hypothetical protein [Merismopedia glauca]|uniref:Uncharacterized protein n=1 Tax=Merismopedia glauca CCAP 1448/3 TaxID=1296344 RepID=A0A2T1BWV9_9CYAN|nr:hypothetical protein [Merismopedia glauca]PSB00404.1 hypothetical protein C7B64_23710 [Merismopedia glauca CCAP 1448/3]
MLNTQSHQPINSIPEAKELLEQLADLRWQKSIIDAKLAEINPLAIEAATLIINNNRAANGKQIAYRNERSEITLQFRTTEPKNHKELESLKNLIEVERDKATRLNAKSIVILQEQIAFLEGKLRELTNTPKGDKLVAKYEQLKMSLTTKQPMLSVKLK